MMEARNDEEYFLDFDIIKDENSDDQADNMMALGLTLNQALSEDNDFLMRDILLKIIDGVEIDKTEKDNETVENDNSN